jgi:3'-5' exoribonuclease
MPEPCDLPRLALGDRVQHPFLVLEVDRRDGGSGSYTALTLGNARGRIPTAPFWAETQHLVAGIGRGDVVQVIGEISQYQQKRQLKVSSIRVLPRAAVDWTGLLPSVGETAPIWERLDRMRSELAGPRLRAVLALFFDDDDFRTRFGLCPAAPSGHHAQVGGLLKHTWEVAHLGRSMARVYRRADADLVVAGALLHDIGKLEAYRWEGIFEVTEAGALIGHVALGLMMLDRAVRARDPMPCTADELLLLEHLVASHHGRLEFGATAPPMTLEAELLHFADNTSARAESFSEALANPEHFQGEALLSQRRLWQLDDRRVHRGRSDWGAT